MPEGEPPPGAGQGSSGHEPGSDPGFAPRAPSDAQLIEQLEQELRKLKVSDVLVQTVFTLSSLGFQKLGEEGRDLEQARLAIESLRALVPVLGDTLPADAIRDLNQTVANLQLAYAKAASG